MWHHGDLDVRQGLVRDGHQQECNVMVAWKLHWAATRDAFLASLPAKTRNGPEPGIGSYRRLWRFSPMTPRRIIHNSTTISEL
jgi:hypothetical protein